MVCTYYFQIELWEILILLIAILMGRWYQTLMKELQQDTIDQIRTHLMYLKQTDLLKNKDILMCLDVVAREYGGVVVDKN